ncbi:hypothetical protein J7E96_34330 [Streptomyces sp. ISL-96]|uniref:hypothetical protein n=1 Tax=Streptomyces sp. ISL-96 TaxID=2819191 RepID=UPI001BE5C56C|nr:hypothetical protein [Streptomyces sp. ISL-96]MBT2493491.1 hypothetical protein [Streptomyces sp. ISL-96]
MQARITRAVGTAVASLAAAVALAGCEISLRDNDFPSPSPVPSATTSRTLGPDGLGELTVGMTLDEAAATGEFERRPDKPGTCMSDVGTNGIRVGWSGKLGITSLTAEDVRTPEGIGAGSTFAEVKRAYPEPADDLAGTLDEQIAVIGTIWTAVPGRPDSMYVFQFDPATRTRADLGRAKVGIVVLKLKAERRC